MNKKQRRRHRFTSNKNLLTLVAFFLVLLAITACTSSIRKNQTIVAKENFVSVKDGKFMLDNEIFRFVGTNNYYMHYSTDKMILDVLNDADNMGFTVLRIWGFQIGPNKDHNSYGLNSPARGKKPGNYGIPEENKSTTLKANQFGYPRDIFERLDYTIAEAGKRGIKLVIAMNNYWADFGGLQQASTWQEWFNLDHPSDFYTNKDCILAYKDYIKTLITRVNSYTGIPYNEDPTIMTWELMNEPRNPQDTSGKVVTAWAKKMSAYVKSLAPYQLCAVGDEGAFIRTDITGFQNEGSHLYNGSEGTDFDKLIALKNIDYGTFHLYPEAWGIAHEAIQSWGLQFISQHIESGEKIGKPVVLEEYGIGQAGLQNRLAIYDSWNKAMFENNGAGTMVWLLTSSNEYELEEGGDGIYDDYDGFRILNDNSTVSNLLRAYAVQFSGETGFKDVVINKPRVYLLDPARDQEAKGSFQIRAQAVDLNQKIQSVKLFINGEPAPAPNIMQYNQETDAYRIKIHTSTYEDGTRLAIKAVFTLADNTILETETYSIFVANNISYSLIKTYDFTTDTANASSLGGYQAEIKQLKHTKLNGGMLEVVCNFPGANEWEELKIKFPTMTEVAEAAKISFTLYMKKDTVFPSSTKKDEASKLPGTQHYLAFDPGWIKTGIGESNTFIKDLPIVTLDDGNEYYKEKIEVAFFGSTSYTELTICPTMGYVQYSGSMFIDDISFFKKD